MNESEITVRDASWRDYLELCKPNVVGLMLVTSIIGMMLSVKEMVPILTLVFGNLGIALCAASAAVINHVVDRHVDDKMARTIGRPVADGRIKPFEAMIFSASMCLFGVLILYLYTNVLTIWLTLASLVGYAFVYTMFLKRTTPYNIVIGGAAGAFPPLIGWAVSTNSIGIEGILLFLLIFLWTPPHFWSLCLITKNDYSITKVPMLTETHGVEATKLQIFIYSIILSIPSILISFSSIGGLIYLISSIFLNVIFIFNAYVLLINSKNLKKHLFVMEKRLFLYSIFYLFVTFLLLLVEHFSKFFLPSYLVMIEDLLWI